MANLAYTYINEGFYEDAKKLIKRAEDLRTKDVDLHPNIGSAKARIEEVLSEEKEQDEKISDKANKMHSFREKHSDLYCLKSEKILEDKIVCKIGEWGTIELNFDKKRSIVSGASSEKIEVHALAALLAGLGSGSPTSKTYKHRKIKVSGEFRNLAGKYHLEVKEQYEYEKEDKIAFEADGFFYVDFAARAIQVLEVLKDKKELLHWDIV